MMKSKIERQLEAATKKQQEVWLEWLNSPSNTNVELAQVFGVSEASIRRWRALHPAQNPPKILIFDLETSPIIGYTWGLWEQNVIEVIQDWKLLSVSYTWYGSGEYQVEQLCDMKSYKHGSVDDKKLTEFLWCLLNEADYVVAHNLNSFDDKKSHAKFIEHNLTPPSPYIKIDTLKIARSNMKMSSNRLDYLGEILGLGRKEKHSGFETWKKSMAGESAAWEEMRKYAKQDVVLLEAIFKRLLPWIKNLQYNLFSEGKVCDNCGSDQLIETNGLFKTKATKKPALKCTSCGSWVKA